MLLCKVILKTVGHLFMFRTTFYRVEHPKSEKDWKVVGTYTWKPVPWDEEVDDVEESDEESLEKRRLKTRRVCHEDFAGAGRD